MATDYDDIIERLTKRKEFQVNLEDVFNEKDLENAIKKSFPEDSRRNALTKNIDMLFNADTTKESVVDNSIEVIDKSKSLRDLESNFDNITSSIGEIGRTNELKIQTAEANKQKDLTSEAPEELTREQLLDLGVQGTSFSKSAGRLGIPQNEFRNVLEDSGFTITERGTIKK